MRTIFFILLLINTCLWAGQPNNFPQAKKIAGTIFEKNKSTLYCKCRYSSDKTVDLASCNMANATNLPRSQKMEWEHMMPASHFGRGLACWHEKLCTDNKGKAYQGRKCCEKIDKSFQQMEGELYNLWPSDGLVNARRSNFSYAQLYPVMQSMSHDFYGCSVVVDSVNHLFEPSDSSKGTAARAMLFMSEHYGIAINNDMYNLMTYWHRQYPPTKWELAWDEAVSAIEGYHNPYILG